MLCSIPLIGAIELRAGPVEPAIISAMKLPEAPNYSWVTEVDDDARAYRIVGATERAGEFSRVTLPVVAALRRRLGLGAGSSDNEITAIYRGDRHLVLNVEGSWKTIDELTRSPEANVIANAADLPRRAAGRASRDGLPLNYSNLQLTLSRPHDEIAIIVANAIDPKAEADGLSGTLGDVGARLLLVHPGQNELTPLHAAGSFRLFIQNGTLTRYSVRLTGQIAVQTKTGRREITVHQNATTTLQRVGATTFTIPDEAVKKLGNSGAN
ncbi:MAG: hypothetical protein RIQ93_3485 [Verrucomicrobiota bacterium]